MRKLVTIAAAAAVSALAGCSATPSPANMQADAHLQRLLADKTAGPPVSCIPRLQTGNARPVMGSGALAFVANPGLVYVSNVEGSGCADIANPNYALVTTSHGSDLCSGDRVEVRDLETRGFHGSCLLSEFVPYRSR